MWKCVFYTSFALSLLTGYAEAQYQPYHCPPAEDVWIVEKEFPEVSGRDHEARVRGNTVIMAEATLRRPVRTGLRPARPGRSQFSAAAQSRPRVAPMLTHDGAVSVDDSSASYAELSDLPPVMPALEWLRAEFTEYGVRCIYTLQDGRDYQQFGLRPAEGMIPPNLRHCGEPQREYLDDVNGLVTIWRFGFDGNLVCDAGRTICHFPCTPEMILESW